MENRIKEQQLDLIAGHTSCHRWWPNQLRLMLSTMAYANGHLYFHNEEGATTVVRGGTDFEVVAENQLDGRHFASAAVIGNDLILRTDKALYRIGRR